MDREAAEWLIKVQRTAQILKLKQRIEMAEYYNAWANNSDRSTVKGRAAYRRLKTLANLFSYANDIMMESAITGESVKQLMRNKKYNVYYPPKGGLLPYKKDMKGGRLSYKNAMKFVSKFANTLYFKEGPTGFYLCPMMLDEYTTDKKNGKYTISEIGKCSRSYTAYYKFVEHLEKVHEIKRGTILFKKKVKAGYKSGYLPDYIIGRGNKLPEDYF